MKLEAGLLVAAGYRKTLGEIIIGREQHFQHRNISFALLKIQETVEDIYALFRDRGMFAFVQFLLEHLENVT